MYTPYAIFLFTNSISTMAQKLQNNNEHVQSSLFIFAWKSSYTLHHTVNEEKLQYLFCNCTNN